ncbi:MAG: ribosomal protein S18-alanine N-acetyltransferase [Acidobacteriota bacterium]|nr:ribosomal protein S18-alanine N-acetyltransferase [Acidobacteriota bacterium]
MTSAGWRVERVRDEKDIAPVLELQTSSFTNPWTADALKWEIEHSPVSRLYVLYENASHSGHAAAFCACWHLVDELHINSLAVAPGRRRAGLATRLMQDVLARAKEEGAVRATLEVRRSNEAARALYERLGFAVEAIRPDYYTNPREDALILWLRDLAAF